MLLFLSLSIPCVILDLLQGRFKGFPIAYFDTGTDDMPKVKFTQSFLLSAKPDASLKGVWYSDSATRGLQLYVGAGGKKTWYVYYRRPDGRSAHHKLGDADLFSVADARNAVLEFLSALARGEEPYRKPESRDKMPLGQFIDDIYGPWVLEHRRSGESTVALLKSSFAELLDLELDTVSVKHVEGWRAKERKRGLRISTINRKVTALRAALNWAYKRGIIEAYPLARLEMLRDESDHRVRYLSGEERERLFEALDARERRLREERTRYNQWLRARGKTPLPSLDKMPFADHLKPMILVSLNTGIRQGSLFALRWSDINMREAILTVRAASSKSGKTVRVPLNRTAREALSAWQKQTRGDGDGLVFPSPKGGGMMDNCKSAWEHLLKDAGIEGFRWHDMRHDFASRLVMAGVDLNTVRELLGHADLKMTLRYAHLAPEAKARAVEALD